MEPDYPPVVIPRSAPRRWYFTLTELLIFTSFAAFLFPCVASLIHVSTEENVPSVDWLPASASNVSYYKSYSFTAYEFDIAEQDFKAWAWVKLEPITQPVTVFRYSSRNEYQASYPPNATQAQIDAIETANENLRGKKVFTGLYYESRTNSGRGVTFVYDRAAGRGYFQSNPR